MRAPANGFKFEKGISNALWRLVCVYISVKWLRIQILYHKAVYYLTIEYIKLIILWRTIKNDNT